MSVESYLENNKLSPGTVLEFRDYATAVIDDSGYVIQTKRGPHSDDLAHCVFTTIHEWLNTLMYSVNNNYVTPLNIWSSTTTIPPSLPIFQSSYATPYKIVRDLLRKNHINFKCTAKESKNMSLAKAKIDLLNLEYDVKWINLRLRSEQDWLAEYNYRNNLLNTIKSQLALLPMETADKRDYIISATKYPRVYVKTSNNKMLPIYYTTDGTESVIVDGEAGKNWASLGLSDFPEFWVNYDGQFIKQEVIYYLPALFEKSDWDEEKTQLELAFSYPSQPDEFGFLPSGKLVYNTKTNQYLQPWQVV